MLTIAVGYSPEYLLKEVATGRENYYTGAVADGEPPGRWWGDGADALGLRGLVDAQDMTGVYERFLDPREEGFNDPSHWDEVFTLGHTGRRYLSEDELYAMALEREPDAGPERRAELRTEAGKGARRNVAFLDGDIQRPEINDPAAHRVRSAGGRRAQGGRRGRRPRVGSVPGRGGGRDMGGQQRRAGVPIGERPGTAGSGITAARPGATWTRTTGSWPASSSTTRGITTRRCTSTTRC